MFLHLTVFYSEGDCRVPAGFNKKVLFTGARVSRGLPLAAWPPRWPQLAVAL